MDTNDIVTIIFSVISLIVSIVIAVITFVQNKKNNNTNLLSRYYEKIFDTFLIESIPESRKYIRFDSNGKLTDYNKFVETLVDIKNSALYFKYQNLDFYKNLKQIIEDLEDFIMDCGNKKFENEEQASIHKDIHERITNIYECINNSYIGSK